MNEIAEDRTRPGRPTLRRGAGRGATRLPWLDSRHTFSFADYHDPAWTGWSVLRVLNEDRVAPGRGFEAHPHRDMEILTVVLAGSLAHRDSLGHGSVLRAGDVQRMTAGRGIVHSEWNPSTLEELHLLQIWILPDRRGLDPGYEERPRADGARRGGLRLVASRDGADGSLRLHQDVRIFTAAPVRHERISHEIASGRTAWVHVVRGGIDVGGEALRAGDGLGLPAGAFDIHDPGYEEPGEILLFDLPAAGGPR